MNSRDWFGRLGSWRGGRGGYAHRAGGRPRVASGNARQALSQGHLNGFLLGRVRGTGDGGCAGGRLGWLGSRRCGGRGYAHRSGGRPRVASGNARQALSQRHLNGIGSGGRVGRSSNGRGRYCGGSRGALDLDRASGRPWLAAFYAGKTSAEFNLHYLRASISEMTSGTRSNRSPMIPKSAMSKIGASSSLLIATMVPAVCMPTRCCTAPEMPTPM